MNNRKQVGDIATAQLGTTLLYVLSRICPISINVLIQDKALLQSFLNLLLFQLENFNKSTTEQNIMKTHQGGLQQRQFCDKADTSHQHSLT